MRSFLGSSLALALALTAVGCGDDLTATDDDGADVVGDHTGIDTSTATPSLLVPELCASRNFDTPDILAKDMVLRTVPTTMGTAVFGIPKSGGSLYGFVTDARGQIMGDMKGTKIISGMYTGFSASRVDGRVVASLTQNDKIEMYVIKDDLTAIHALDTVGNSDVLSPATVIHQKGNRIALAGGSDGVVVTRFDHDWASQGQSIYTRDIPTSLSSSSYGSDAMFAWSTQHGCSVARMGAELVSSQHFECNNNHIAIDPSVKGGHMLFEGADGIHDADILVGAQNELATEHVIAPHGTSPRIGFDGTHFWGTYLDIHGSLVVGYMAPDGHLRSITLSNVRPDADAYDLAVSQNEVWVYAVDGTNGYTASRVCLTAE
ncbi:MAG TPA: hypothetical protein VGM39_18160 [Kofleriaceae bacterium]|jgi:hypothetical protein